MKVLLRPGTDETGKVDGCGIAAPEPQSIERPAMGGWAASVDPQASQLTREGVAQLRSRVLLEQFYQRRGTIERTGPKGVDGSMNLTRSSNGLRTMSRAGS